MRKVSWKGVYPAVTTKFDHKGGLDIPAFVQNITAQADAGIDGIVIGGSLGESSTLSHQDRMDLLQAALVSVGDRIDIIVNIAEGSTANAIALAQLAERQGAHGLMLLPPMMYKPTDREVADFFAEVAVSTSLPIMLYNNPVDYKIEVTTEMLAELQEYSNIQAIKESTRDISNVTRLRNLFGDRYRILCGVDTIALEELVMGADGWVAGLVDAFPAETVAIYRLAKAGRIEEAREIVRWFMPILELDLDPQLVQNIKLAESLTGLGNENVRPPRKKLSGKRREEVLAILQQGLATRPRLPEYLSIAVEA